MATLRNFCVRASALVMAGMLVMAPGAAADPAVDPNICPYRETTPPAVD